MGEEPRGIEKFLTAGPPHAQVSVRILLPILFAVLAVELTALSFLAGSAKNAYVELQMKELPPATTAALNSAALHGSPLGIAAAAVLLLAVIVLCRKGVFDATGRWLCLALTLGLAVYPVCFLASILLPFKRVAIQLIK